MQLTVMSHMPTPAVRGGAPVMGFGQSAKEMSDDPTIPEVLKYVKADQALRFARASMDGSAFAATLPGVLAPFGFFDPMGFTPQDQDEVLMWRESELVHGRVSMLAVVGFFVQEELFGQSCIAQFQQVLSTEAGQTSAAILLTAVFAAEIARMRIGFEGADAIAVRTLRPNYSPGRLGFDPLKQAAKLDGPGYLAMQNKELNNGRLAMIGVAGMAAQEAVTGSAIFA